MPPKLINQLKEFNKIITKNKDANYMDISDYSFISPTTLLPLIQYMELNNITQYHPNPKTKIHLPKVLGKEKHDDTTIPLRKLKQFKFTDYFKVEENIEEYLDGLTDELIGFLPKNIDLNGINLLLYEILSNVYKHSYCDNAYIICQKYPRSNIIDIGVIDDGVSIPKSLEDADMSFENDSEAIFSAINGANSDKEKENLHGRGLNTSAIITALGFNGEMLISSRNGTCTVGGSEVMLWGEDVSHIKGTFVALRININKIKDIHEYTKKRVFKKL